MCICLYYVQHIFPTRHVIFDHEWHLQFHVHVVRNKLSVNTKWYIKGGAGRRQCTDRIGVETLETRITRFFSPTRCNCGRTGSCRAFLCPWKQFRETFFFYWPEDYCYYMTPIRFVFCTITRTNG